MKNYIVIFGLLALSFAANASNIKIQMRSEEGRWIVEKIGVAADGWPEILSRQTYPTEQAAQVQLQTLQSANPLLFTTQDLQVQPTMASGVLWVTRNQWNNDWEEKFGQWIEKEVDADFFVRNKVRTDCADVAYSLRWIFAYMNGLPAGANLGGSSGFMTNETVRGEWTKLPTATEWNQNKRFLKALDYLLDQTYTHTLWGDSFPVALNRRALLSGSYHLGLRDRSGHTQVVRWFGEEAKVPFITLNSTVPRAVRTLMESMLWAEYPEKGQSGLLRFRWAVKSSSGIKLLPGKDMPGYSLEQFDFKTQKEFPIALFEKLGYPTDVKTIREFLYKDILEQMQTRVDIVKQGTEKCKTISCKPGTQGYEDWGTPSRDGRITGKLKTVQGLTQYSPAAIERSPYFDKEVVVLEGISWNFEAMLWNWRHGVFSSDPTLTESQRWGAGGQSWVQDQKNYFSQKLSSREASLKSSMEVCKTKDCSMMSPLWSTVSSSQTDSEIRKRTSYISGGRGILPSQIFEYFDQARNENVYSIYGRNISLQFIMQNQAGMNASPLAKPLEQWGLANTVTLLPSNTAPYFNKWILSVAMGYVMNADTNEVLNLPGKLLAALQDQAILVLNEQGQISFLNLQTNELKRSGIALDQEDKVWSGADYLLVVSAGASTFYKISKPSLDLTVTEVIKDVLEAKQVDGIYLSKSGLLVDRTNNLRWSINPEENIVSINEKTLMTISLDFNYHVYSRVTGVAHSLDFLKGSITVVPSEDLSVLTAFHGGDGGRPGSEIYVLDNDYRVLSKQTMPGVYCFAQNDGKRVMCFKSEESFMMEKVGNHFERVNIPGKLIWMDEHFLLKLEDGKRVLYDRASMRVLFKAHKLGKITDELFAVSMNQTDGIHIVNIKSPMVPLLTNVADEVWAWNYQQLSADPQNFLLKMGTEESLWSRGINSKF
jgi:hypothetical protein